MISEYNICKLLSERLPSGRVNECFESDAEVIRLNGTPCLFTTDEFSREDLFGEGEPALLGWNIAAGALSDILACGGTPLYYAHALTIDPRWDEAYLGRFADGVAEVLNQAGVRFIGGDCGRSELWRCTVSVLGSCAGPPILRRGARVGDAIYISGPIGGGNLEAARHLLANEGAATAQKLSLLSPLRLPLRVRESAVMRRYASACMDTSDGVWNALTTLADLNGCGYEGANLPYLQAGPDFCRAAGLPRVLLFLGECGEYELLCTVGREREEAFLIEAKDSGVSFFRLGHITRGARLLCEDESTIDLGTFRLQARDYESTGQYLEHLLQRLAKLPLWANQRSPS